MAERRPGPGPVLAVLAAALVLGPGCSETRLVFHAAKQMVPGDSNATPRTRGTYKVGQPYQVAGVWYYPAVDYSYSETGIASWYGPEFHGKRTANGEIFDMNAMTAAHKTLPLPSIVRVINLKNGRAVKLRVNDRGPFVNGRLIDVSRRAAQLLGFEANGTAPVRVEIIPDESRAVAALASGGGATPLAAAPAGDVKVQPLPGAPAPAAAPPQLAAASPPPRGNGAAPPPIVPKPEVTWVQVKPANAMFVQAGAFVHRDYAVRLQRRLSSIGHARVVEATVGNRRFWRVRLGPVATVEEGDRLLERVLASGHTGARLVVD